MTVTYDTPGDRPGRRDYGSRTEADAGAYERMTTEVPSRLEMALDAGYEPEDER